MTDPIEAVLFDVGGTLRVSLQGNESIKLEKVRQISELVDAKTPIPELSELLSMRYKAYRRWARETSVELNESSLWTRWMLPEQPSAQVEKIALELNQLWRDGINRREVLPDTKDVLTQLFRRGYHLGIVSNTVSSVEVPAALRQLELSGILETVILSCDVGIRKPNPAILLEAANRMGIAPEKCAYVGDRHDRDVIGAHTAGFSEAILIYGSDLVEGDDPDKGSFTADHYIHNLRELLDIFPARNAPVQPRQLYKASCSTMWARHNFPELSDFFEAARRLGFAQVELNHQIDSSVLKGVDLSRQALSSVHEPCPADVSVEELKARDWLISSPNEECREHGVEAIQRSVDLAAEHHLPVVVVHAGMVSTDAQLEQKLRKLFEAGRSASDDYRRVKAELTEFRQRRAPACMESVKKSLHELLEYASRSGVRLGLENRYHYYDIPNLDEMGELLALGDIERLGFVYDVGHAQHLDRLGFHPHEEWLRRYASRIIEVHLHDVRGLHDHVSPGLGDVNFDMVAAYLPAEAIRTLELQPVNTPGEVAAGLEYLAAHGCIKSITGL